jgi:hypothetical protein
VVKAEAEATAQQIDIGRYRRKNVSYEEITLF